MRRLMFLMSVVGILMSSHMVHASPYSAAIAPVALDLPDIVRACIPGRAQPVFNFTTGRDIRPVPACHCPPKELCELDNSGRLQMPTSLLEQCCPTRRSSCCPGAGEEIFGFREELEECAVTEQIRDNAGRPVTQFNFNNNIGGDFTGLEIESTYPCVLFNAAGVPRNRTCVEVCTQRALGPSRFRCCNPSEPECRGTRPINCAPNEEVLALCPPGGLGEFLDTCDFVCVDRNISQCVPRNPGVNPPTGNPPTGNPVPPPPELFGDGCGLGISPDPDNGTCGSNEPFGP